MPAAGVCPTATAKLRSGWRCEGTRACTTGADECTVALALVQSENIRIVKALGREPAARSRMESAVNGGPWWLLLDGIAAEVTVVRLSAVWGAIEGGLGYVWITSAPYDRRVEELRHAGD
jgi:hypothetical protein